MNPVPVSLRWSLKLSMLSVALLPSWAAAADIEKWVDHSGRVHYGEQAPPWAVARPVIVQHNIIETGPVVAPAATVKRPTSRQPVAGAPGAPQRQRAEIRSYVELCRVNRGIDCEREARAMIDGPATQLFPGDPLIFPRPDLRPPPPPLPRPVPERL